MLNLRHKVACVLIASTVTSAKAQDKALVVLESYPVRVQARMQIEDKRLQEIAAKKGVAGLEGVVTRDRTWKAGSTLTVAFLGGDENRCQEIVALADQWTKDANIKFSCLAAGRVRRWSPEDKEFAADIRVSFVEGGPWSLVGTCSRDTALTGPGEASLNLEGFDRALPVGWESLVLHEFGHALGFNHEHKHPGMPCDFLWEDEAGYVPTKDEQGRFIPDQQGLRPGVYTVLGGPPKEWPRDLVDSNLKPLEQRSTNMYLKGPFDSKSVMKYHLPDWMFMGRDQSYCYTDQPNNSLSKGDLETMAKAYPQP